VESVVVYKMNENNEFDEFREAVKSTEKARKRSWCPEKWKKNLNASTRYKAAGKSPSVACTHSHADKPIPGVKAVCKAYCLTEDDVQGKCLVHCKVNICNPQHRVWHVIRQSRPCPIWGLEVTDSK